MSTKTAVAEPQARASATRRAGAQHDQPASANAASGVTLRRPPIGVTAFDRQTRPEPPAPATPIRVYPSLVVGRVDDPAERGADQFAAATLRSLGAGTPAAAPTASGAMQGGLVRRQPASGCGCSSCRGGERRIETVWRAPAQAAPDRGGMAVPARLTTEVRAATVGGQALPAPVRARFEAASCRDLSAVRVRTDPAAAATATALRARAYTLDSGIVFAPGEYAPETAAGRQLLAHEIGHVVQAGAAPPLGEHATPAGPTQVVHRTPGSGGPAGSLIDVALGLLPAAFANTLRRIRAEGGILPYLRSLISGALRAVFGTLPDLSPGLGAAITAIQGIGGRITAILAALASGDCAPLFAAIAELRDTISAAIGDAWNRITEFLTPVGQFFTDIWNRFGAPAISRLSELAGDAGQWLEDLGRDLWDLTAPVRDYAGSLWTDLKRWIGIGEETDQAGGNESQGILGWLTARASEAWIAIKAAAAPVIRPIGELVAAVRDALPLQAISDLRTTISDWLSQTASSVDALNEPATTGSAAGQARLRDVLLPALANIIGGLRGGFSAARTWVASAIGGLAGQVTGLLDAASESALFAPLGTALRWLRAAAGRVTTFATDAVGAAFGFVDQGLGLLGGFAQRMLDSFIQIVETAADLPGRFGNMILGPFWRAIPACIRNPVVDFITNQILRRIPVFSQLLDIPDLWNRCVHVALGIIRDLFVDGNFARGLFRFFSAMLGLIGIPADLVTSIISKAATALSDILHDPLGFVINMLTALKQGFSGFFGNALTHLLGGVSGWLFHQAEQAGLRPPAQLSLGEVFRFILDILGIGLDFVIARIERISPPAAAMVRRGAAFAAAVLPWINDLITEGPGALWRHLTDQLSNLWETAIGAVASWVSGSIMAQMVPRLLSMLDPSGIGAVVNSLIAIYRAIQSAAEYLLPMLRIVNSVCDGIGQIARGALDGAAAFVEGALARAVPIIVGFLANQIGLGSLGQRIGETVEALRERIAGAVDSLLERGRALLLRLTGGGAEQPGAAAASGARPSAPTDIRAVAIADWRDSIAHHRPRNLAELRALADGVVTRHRPQGLSRLGVQTDPTGEMHLLAYASPPQGVTVRINEIFSPETAQPDLALYREVLDTLTGTGPSFETIAVVSVDGAVMGARRNAVRHAESELLASPDWPLAVASARTRAARNGTADLVLTLNRSPCKAVCTGVLSNELMRIRSSAPGVRFILAATGRYSPTTTKDDMIDLILHNMDAQGYRLKVPLSALQQASRADVVALFRQCFGDIMHENSVHRDEITDETDLRRLAGAGWQLRQLQVFGTQRPAGGALARMIERLDQDLSAHIRI